MSTNARNDGRGLPSVATGGFLMITALAGALAVFSSAGFTGSARIGGFGVNPMAVTAIVGALSTAPQPAKTTVAGVEWFDSVQDAEKVSEAQDKPILVFQLFGKIDDAFC